MSVERAADGAIVVDARGLLCPEPIMMLHNAVREAEVGALIEVIATDPSTMRDVAQFCQHLGHRLVSQLEQETVFHHRLRKGE